MCRQRRIKKISGLNCDEPLARMILDDYNRINEGATIMQMLRSADELNHRNLQNVI